MKALKALKQLEKRVKGPTPTRFEVELYTTTKKQLKHVQDFMKVTTRKVKLCAMATIAAFILCNCTAQQRLNHLLKRHPDLIKTDTAMLERTVTVPGFTADTTFAASTRVDSLPEVLAPYVAPLDSATREHLTNAVAAYVVRRACLDTTFTFPLPGGGVLTIFESQGKFHAHIERPAQQATVSTPAVIHKVTAEKRNSWEMFLSGGFVVVLILAAVAMIWGHTLNSRKP